MTSRRMFVAGAITLVVRSIAAEAQQAVKVARVGVVVTYPQSVAQPWFEALRDGLRSLGWIEGRNLLIDFRSAEGKADRVPGLVAELLRPQADVLVTFGALATRAAKQATATVPIVMGFCIDPLGQGIVASLARPGGNVTGMMWDGGPDVGGKRLELLREIVPGMSRLAILWNPDFPGQDIYWEVTKLSAKALSITLDVIEMRTSDQLDKALSTVLAGRPQALYVWDEEVLSGQARRIIDFALRHRLPTMFSERAPIDAGGLLAYETNLADLTRRSASYVDRILKGARPADLPVQRPTTFSLIVNLKTAKALGLTIPPAVLARADEVIE